MIACVLRRTKIIAEILQAFAIVGAGVWTIYTFSAKREASLAEAAHQKLVLENVQAEKKARDSLVKVELVIESVEKTDDGHVIALWLHVTNKGGADHELKMDDRSIRLARVHFGAPENPVTFEQRQYTSLYGLPLDHPDWGFSKADSLLIRAGADSKYMCLFHVVEPGVYYAEFKASYGGGVIFSGIPVFVGLSGDMPIVARTSWQ